MIKLLVVITMLLAAVNFAHSQNQYKIKGQVKDAENGELVGYATVQIWNTSTGVVTDSIGNFEIDDVKPGSYRLQISFLGYKTLVTPEFEVTNKDYYISSELESGSQALSEVNIVATPFKKLSESPIGMRVIGLKEIEKSAGGNRDISRVVQTFPGVASTAAFRNDLMVRGGGPAENRFYLDGVEIPTINHFATQGASGGPVGIINPDFIREVNFFSAAFPASRGNALSSVLDFKLKDGNKEKYSLRGVVGASEVGLSSNGPLGKNTTYQVSVRRSYLQFLFDMIGLPFLPTFNDGQFKIKHTFNKKNELILLGLGAIDNMKLNTGMKDMSEENQYILGYLPVIKQKTYTIGGVYKHYADRSNHTFVLSRSYLNNKNIKYKDNIEQFENLVLNYRSKEISNKFRSENTFFLSQFQINGGVSLEYNQFKTNTYKKHYNDAPVLSDYNTDIAIWQWGLYGNVIYESKDNSFSACAAIRSDANNYSSSMRNLLDQLSPRVSFSYRILPSLYLNGNVGRYAELPPYTALAYKNANGEFENKENNIKYIKSNQYSLGLEFRLSSYLKFTGEGFYKSYLDYPMSILDSIPLSSKGAEYGVLGDEAVKSTAKGRAYGFEIMGRWYNYRGLTFIGSYTYVRSEFKDGRKGSGYIPTAWDNRHLFTFSGTYSLPKNWDIGAKLRLVGGAPYTPYDLDKSSLVEAADLNQGLFYDYDRFNSERLNMFGQLDIRIDKTFYLKKVMIGVYLDLQNVTNSKYKQQDVYLKTGNIVNPDAPQSEQRYEMKAISNSSGTLLPSIGIIVEI